MATEGVVGAVASGQVAVVGVNQEITIHDYATDQPMKLAPGSYHLKRGEMRGAHDPGEFMLFVLGTKKGMPEVVWRQHPFVRFNS